MPQAARIHNSLALSAEIRARTACVGITGLGYEGSPVAVEFARAGQIAEADVSAEKADRVNAGEPCGGCIPTATTGQMLHFAVDKIQNALNEGALVDRVPLDRR
jgi:hypothetical protein